METRDSLRYFVSYCSNGKTMLLSERTICGSKKSRFLKEQEAKGLINNLDLKTPLRKIPLSQICTALH